MVQGNRVGSWVMVVLMLLASSLVSIAQQNPSPQSIDQLLNPDGSLQLGKGIQGSFRADGYKLELGPNGEPRFLLSSTQSNTADTADVHWDNRFGCPTGFDGQVLAIYVDGGTVYFGGYFTVVGATSARGIVKWDGNAWSALGSGLGGYVNAISKFHNEIYVGGRFFSLAGGPGNCIARWDGNAWYPLGVPPNDGVNSDVAALLPVGDSLYIGGDFYWGLGNDTTKVNGVAIWDGSAIIPMQGDHIRVYSGVKSLATDGTNLFVGAAYVEMGSWPSLQTARGIIRWDRTSWEILGLPGQNGVRGYANNMVWLNGSLYVGGEFDSAGNVSANNIARWNGSTWSTLGAGLNGPVYSLMLIKDKLYAGGAFSASGIDTMNAVAFYDTNGAVWSLVSPGVAPRGSWVRALASGAGNILMGGMFAPETDPYSNGYVVGYCAASWDGATLSQLGMTSLSEGITGRSGTLGLGEWRGGQVNAIAVSGSNVYVAGNFMTAGSIKANNIACWNSSTQTWSALGKGTDQSITSLALNGTDLYAGGFFYNAGGSPANRVARWDGSAWHPLGTPPNDGVDGWVFAVLYYSGNLYVGGEIYGAGGTALSAIARWNGNTWSGLGSGLSGWLTSLGVLRNVLYAGGQINQAGGSPVNNIAAWDGVSWKTLGIYPDDGVNYLVYALHTFGDHLYVGGYFTKAGTIDANHIARWNGSSWSTLGPGVDGIVRTIASSGPNIFVGGDFTSSGILTVNQIARWDTASATWAALGSGTNSKVFVVAPAGNDLFAGGYFTVAGDKASAHFARWNSTFTASGVNHDDPLPASFALQQNYPNPFNPSTSIGYTVGGIRHQESGFSDVRLVVYDLLGREVATLVNERKAPGQYEVKFDASALASGVYLYRLQVGGNVNAMKMVLMK